MSAPVNCVTLQLEASAKFTAPSAAVSFDFRSTAKPKASAISAYVPGATVNSYLPSAPVYRDTLLAPSVALTSAPAIGFPPESATVPRITLSTACGPADVPSATTHSDSPRHLIIRMSHSCH